jgi:hypothetical protein
VLTGLAVDAAPPAHRGLVVPVFGALLALPLAALSSLAGGGAEGVATRVIKYPIVTLEKTAIEYDRKPGMKWLRCTAK